MHAFSNRLHLIRNILKTMELVVEDLVKSIQPFKDSAVNGELMRLWLGAVKDITFTMYEVSSTIEEAQKVLRFPESPRE